MGANLKSRVLVADDYEPLRYLKAHYLLGAGFQVLEADNGTAAFRFIETERPELVVLDVNFSDRHGPEVCREITARWTLPVVCTSSADIPVDLHGTADSPVVNLNEEDLLDVVRQALDTRSGPKPRPNGSPGRGSTRFASARRSPPPVIAAQAGAFESLGLKDLLDASPASLFVFNKNRQIVFCNRAALSLAGAASLPTVLGLWPGEALRCVHSTQAPEGCQTPEFCQTCRAVLSVLGGLAGVTKGRKCRIVRSLNGWAQVCDFMAIASPIKGRSGFTACTLTDISHEKRRRELNRLFLQDFLRIAGGVNGFAAHPGDKQESGIHDDLMAIVDQCAAELVAGIDRLGRPS